MGEPLKDIGNTYFFVYYYGMDRREKEKLFSGNEKLATWYLVVSILPFWSRFWQCMRKWRD